VTESQPRTPIEQAEFLLSYWGVDALKNAFNNLSVISKVRRYERVMALLFISADFRNRIQYYVERAPISSKATLIGMKLLRDKNFNNALVIEKADFPKAHIWNGFFDQFVVAYIFARTENMMLVNNGVLSRGQNFTHYTFGRSKTLLQNILGAHKHFCVNIVAKRLMDNGYTYEDIRHFSLNRRRHLRPGKLYHCPCGHEQFYDSSISNTKLLKIYNKHVGPTAVFHI
jgi:hypothetical protein